MEQELKLRLEHSTRVVAKQELNNVLKKIIRICVNRRLMDAIMIYALLLIVWGYVIRMAYHETGSKRLSLIDYITKRLK